MLLPRRPIDAVETERLMETAPPHAAARTAEAAESAPSLMKRIASKRFQVEVAPFQSIFISAEHAFIFRRIAIRNQIYRQGFVL